MRTVIPVAAAIGPHGPQAEFQFEIPGFYLQATRAGSRLRVDADQLAALAAAVDRARWLHGQIATPTRESAHPPVGGSRDLVSPQTTDEAGLQAAVIEKIERLALWARNPHRSPSLPHPALAVEVLASNLLRLSRRWVRSCGLDPAAIALHEARAAERRIHEHCNCDRAHVPHPYGHERYCPVREEFDAKRARERYGLINHLDDRRVRG